VISCAAGKPAIRSSGVRETSLENRNDFSSLNQRLADMAARLEVRVREQMRPSPEARGQGFFRATYAGLHDLFTRDVTQEGLRVTV